MRCFLVAGMRSDAKTWLAINWGNRIKMILRRPSATLLLAALSALAVSACATSPAPASAPAKVSTPVAAAPAAKPVAPAAPAATKVVERPAAFAVCAACHGSTANASPGLGPNLFGIGGKPAGSAHPDFDYSDALKKSGKVWNAETLAAFLQDPGKYIPDNNMDYPGVSDAASAKAIAEYTASLK